MITIEELKELLSYDPNTGKLLWLVNRGRLCRKGQVAGSSHSGGYWKVKIKGRLYQAHRLAWLYMTGSFPKDDIDHINRVRDDNRFANLREATRRQNQANGIGWAKSGLKGVYPNSKTTWKAQICSREYLGSFKTKEEAHQAYCAAAREKFGQYFRSGK